jgi:hypothetical protein
MTPLKQTSTKRDPQGTDEAYEQYFNRLRALAAMNANFDSITAMARAGFTQHRIRDSAKYITHMYGSGAQFAEIKAEIRNRIALMEEDGVYLRTEAVKVMPYSADIHGIAGERYVVPFVALTLLLNESSEELRALERLFPPVQGDRLYALDLLVRAFIPEHQFAKKYKPKKWELDWTEPLLRAIAQPHEARAQGLASYMKNWCRLMKSRGWKPNLDTRPGHDELFCDFAFEVALAVCAYDIDDSSFADHPYYPRDVVEYYRANVRATRDSWREANCGAGVEVAAPPPPKKTDLSKPKRKGIGRWLDLASDGDTDTVESVLETVGKPKKVKDLGELMEALSVGPHAVQGACQNFCVERGHEIMPKGLFHDRCNDHEEAKKEERAAAVPSRTDRPVAGPSPEQGR